MNKKNNFPKVSIVVPVYNVKNSLKNCLDSLKQDYPISEIIIIDNHSTDNSVEIAEKFKDKNKSLNIKIVKRKKTYGVSASYNLGVKLAKEKYVVTVHSDGVVESKNELKKLMEPILLDPSVVAVYPIGLLPRDLWMTYNFWQKCLFARDVEHDSRAVNGLFDCYKRDIFFKIGGYDEERFNNTFGSEDADMAIRLRREGKVVPSEARIIHQHSFTERYTYKDWISRRKFLAVAYGHLMRVHGMSMKKDVLIYFVKPALVVCALLGFFYPLLFLPVFAFPFFYMSRMFTDPVTLKDFRIILLPFLLIFLIFYEAFWTVSVLIFNRVVR